MGRLPDSRGLAALAAHRREALLLAFAAMLGPLAQWAWTSIHFPFNDFHDYWLAGRLILEGRSPYDVQALGDLARTEHLSFLVGGGYSYPLPFAIFMAPFALLSFQAGLILFLCLSIVAFGMAVAIWLGWATGWDPGASRRRVALALAAGLYPPIEGTITSGQANLILFPLLAGGAGLALAGGRGWRVAGGVLLGLAAIVKLVPAVVVVPLGIGRRWGAAAGTVAGALSALVVAAMIAPFAGQGGSGLVALLDPDPFYSNQSINGFVTRLVRDGDRTVALWNDAFDPRLPMLVITGAFGLLTLAVLWRSRGALATRRGLALGLGLALVAGTIGAPKNSFWNESFCLVAVGLLVAVEAPDLRLGRLGRTDALLLGAWFGTALFWAALWALSPPATVPLAPVLTLLQSTSLYGLFALWWLFARRLVSVQNLEPAGESPDS